MFKRKSPEPSPIVEGEDGRSPQQKKKSESETNSERKVQDEQNLQVSIESKIPAADIVRPSSADKHLMEIQTAIRECVQPHWKEAWKVKMFELADKIEVREINLPEHYGAPGCEVTFSTVVGVGDHQSKSEVKMRWASGWKIKWLFREDGKVVNEFSATSTNHLTIRVEDVHLLRNYLYSVESAELGMPLNLFYTVFCAVISKCTRFKYNLACQRISWEDARRYPKYFRKPVNQLFILPQHFNKELLDETVPEITSEMKPGEWFDGRGYSNYLFVGGTIQRINWVKAHPLINLQQMRRISKILFANTPEKSTKLAVVEDVIRRLSVITTSKSRFDYVKHPEEMITSNLFSISSDTISCETDTGMLQLVWKRAGDEHEWKCGLRRINSSTIQKSKRSMWALEEDTVDSVDLTNAIASGEDQVYARLENQELIDLMEWHFLNNYECARNISASAYHESATCCSQGNDRNIGRNIGNYCQKSNFADFGNPSGVFVSNFTFVRAVETFEATIADLHKLLTLPTLISKATVDDITSITTEKPAVLIKEVVDIVCGYHQLTCPSPQNYNLALGKPATNQNDE